MRPLRVARDLGLLPGRQVLIELSEGGCGLRFQPRNLFIDLDLATAIGLYGSQLLDFGFEFGDRFFKIEIRAHRIWGMTGGAPDAGAHMALCRAQVKQGHASVPNPKSVSCCGLLVSGLRVRRTRANL
jgi:hypothetical protein